VMYVLKHADRPGLYHGLPENPRISPLVGLWKGALKPFALLAMGLTAVAGFVHYLKIGRNDADAPESASPGRSVQSDEGPS